MEIIISKDKITREHLKSLYNENSIEMSGNYDIEKVYNAIKNSYLVAGIWNSDVLKGFCRIISDGIYFARIQELILSPDIRETDDIITELLNAVFNECKGIKSFHMNPGVYEKKEIYTRKHSSLTPRLRKIYWSIHEDEF